MNEVAFFFLCDFLGKYFEDGSQLWDEECVSNIIDVEKLQYNDAKVEVGK